MARQRLGEKKTRKLREKTGLPVVRAVVRGGTDHRIDLYLEGGVIMSLYRDGTLERVEGFTWNNAGQDYGTALVYDKKS